MGEHATDGLPVAWGQHKLVVQVVDCVAEMQAQRLLSVCVEEADTLCQVAIPDLNSCDRHA
jgi:hypothetical protein